jgi:hypothetical protein
VYIEFLSEFGDLPLLTADIRSIDSIDPSLAPLNYGYVMNITEYQKGNAPILPILFRFLLNLPPILLHVTAGTKEDIECSGQGTCSEVTGRCSCFQGFGSSNGTASGPGER